MDIAGGALIPLLFATLKDKGIASNHIAFFICMFPSYLYILYYGLKGYKAGKKIVKAKILRLETI